MAITMKCVMHTLLSHRFGFSRRSAVALFQGRLSFALALTIFASGRGFVFAASSATFASAAAKSAVYDARDFFWAGVKFSEGRAAKARFHASTALSGLLRLCNK